MLERNPRIRFVHNLKYSRLFVEVNNTGIYLSHDCSRMSKILQCPIHTGSVPFILFHARNHFQFLARGLLAHVKRCLSAHLSMNPFPHLILLT
jgi:hypothetical protein